MIARRTEQDVNRHTVLEGIITNLKATIQIINIIARRTGKDVNSHTVLDGIITTIKATNQRINIIGSREGSRNRRRLKANQTGKKFRVGIKSNISTNRNNLISGVDRCIHLNAMKKTTITSINRQTIKI